MSLRLPLLAPVAIVLGAAGFALFRSSSAPTPVATTGLHAGAAMGEATEEAEGDGEEANDESAEGADEADPHAGLPPGHIPVDGPPVPAPPLAGHNHGGKGGAPGAEGAEGATLTWKVPGVWTTLANPSAMRMATYRVPRAAKDPADGEVSVMRAGGSTAANVARWVGQFEPGAKSSQSTRTVHGLRVTVLDVDGTYLGGMGNGAGGSEPAKGWALVAAVVETPGMPHFFKMTGPAATVHAARGAFDALLASLAPNGV